jgi:hypothetical protein
MTDLTTTAAYLPATGRHVPQHGPAGDLFDVLAELSGDRSPDFRRRALVCTPCGGWYVEVAYWLIVVNGSPPPATVLYYPRSPEVRCNYRFRFKGATYIDDYRPRRLSVRQSGVVQAFAKKYLTERNIEAARPVRLFLERT